MHIGTLGVDIVYRIYIGTLGVDVRRTAPWQDGGHEKDDDKGYDADRDVCGERETCSEKPRI